MRFVFKGDVKPAQTLRNSNPKWHLRFSQLKKKFTGDGALLQQFIEFMEKYHQLDHMIEIPPDEKDTLL